MAFGIGGDSLEVRVSASTASATSKIERVREKLGDLTSQAAQTAGGLQVLQGRTDEAGDEMTTLGAKAATAGFGIRSLTASIPTLNLGLISVSGTMTTLVIPALLTLSTVLLPLAAAATTVGAALGGIGLGVVAGTAAAASENLELLKTAFSTMVESLQEAVAPLADAFLPLLLAIMYRIPRVVERTIELTGGFVEFRDAVWGVADAFFDLMPSLLATLFEFGQMALPILREFLQSLDGGIRPALMGMLQVTQRIAPTLMEFGQAFIDALPALTRLGTIVLETVVPALSDLFGIVDNLLSSGFEGGGSGFVTGLINIITSGIGQLEQWLSNGGGQQQIAGVMTALFGALDQGLGDEDSAASGVVDTVLGVLGSVFDALMNALRSGEAGELSRSLGEFGVALWKDLNSSLIEYVTGGEFASDAALLANALANVLGSVIRGAINEAIPNEIGFQIPEFSVGGRTFGGDSVNMDLPNNPVSEQVGGIGQASTTPGSGGGSGKGSQLQDFTESLTVEVTGTLEDENGEIRALIDSRTATRFEDQQRAVNRTRGTTR